MHELLIWEYPCAQITHPDDESQFDGQTLQFGAAQPPKHLHVHPVSRFPVTLTERGGQSAVRLHSRKQSGKVL